MSEAIDKLANHVDSPLSRLRKLSPSLVHAYGEYPLFSEAVDFVLSIAFVDYFATFFARIVLGFKTDLVDHLIPFVYDYYKSADEFFLTHVLIGLVDKYVPLLKTTHYKDLKPSELKKVATSKAVELEGYVKTTAEPIVNNTVNSVNPMLAPVNKTLESVMEQYLPPTTAAPVEGADKNEVTKLYALTLDATGRTMSAVQNTASRAMKLPSDITGHVSKIYGSELKEHKSIPSALVHTSSELVSEVTTNLGLHNKTAAVSTAVETKVNGVVQAGADAAGAVRGAAEKVESQLNGQISVGA